MGMKCEKLILQYNINRLANCSKSLEAMRKKLIFIYKYI